MRHNKGPRSSTKLSNTRPLAPPHNPRSSPSPLGDRFRRPTTADLVQPTATGVCEVQRRSTGQERRVRPQKPTETNGFGGEEETFPSAELCYACLILAGYVYRSGRSGVSRRVYVEVEAVRGSPRETCSLPLIIPPYSDRIRNPISERKCRKREKSYPVKRRRRAFVLRYASTVTRRTEQEKPYATEGRRGVGFVDLINQSPTLEGRRWLDSGGIDASRGRK